MNRWETATTHRKDKANKSSKAEENMKILLAIAGVVIIGVLILGFLFVRWANQPENVAALQKEREREAAQKIEDDKKKVEDAKKQVEIDKEIEAKKANLKLVIDENFANNRFEFLDYKFQNSSQFKFKDNQFNYYVFSTRGSNPNNHFIFSKEDFTDFAAEIDFRISGYEAIAGIFWDAQPNGDRDPTVYQAAYSSASGLNVEAGDTEESFNLGSFFESVTEQKLRVERFANRLKVSVNDKVLFDKIVKDTGQGKVGIFLRNRGGNKDESSNSISIDIKSFKIWK